MAWKKGPLPKGTFNWGGVMVKGTSATGFHFADFCGDHVKLPMSNNKRVEAQDVAYYDNSLEVPQVLPE
jgi:hypothetical protein